MKFQQIIEKCNDKFKRTIKSCLRLHIDIPNRIRLKNKTFSIISSNCLGGLICSNLNIRFNSPTINLLIKPADFVKFLSNLKFYLDCDVEEIKVQGIDYPVGKLGGGDVLLHFVHYKSFEEAKQKWNTRKQRINFDNIFVIMAQRNGCTYEDLKAFDKLEFKNKVVFTAKEYPEINSAYVLLGRDPKDEDVGDLPGYKNRRFGKRWIDDFDYVSFLNRGINKQS